MSLKPANPQKRQLAPLPPALQPTPPNGSSPVVQRESKKHGSVGPAQVDAATSLTHDGGGGGGGGGSGTGGGGNDGGNGGGEGGGKRGIP